MPKTLKLKKAVMIHTYIEEADRDAVFALAAETSTPIKKVFASDIYRLAIRRFLRIARLKLDASKSKTTAGN